MFPEQGAPALSITVEGTQLKISRKPSRFDNPNRPARKVSRIPEFILVHVQYKGNDEVRMYEKTTKVREIIADTASKLHCPLDFYEDWQNFTLYIGHNRISENREIGFYHGLLKANFHTITIRDRPATGDMVVSILNDYSSDEIQHMFNVISQMKETVELSNEATEEIYKDYLVEEGRMEQPRIKKLKFDSDDE